MIVCEQKLLSCSGVFYFGCKPEHISVPVFCQWEVKKIYENIAELILRTIQENTAILVTRRHKQATKENYVLSVRVALSILCTFKE